MSFIGPEHEVNWILSSSSSVKGRLFLFLLLIQGHLTSLDLVLCHPSIGLVFQVGSQHLGGKSLKISLLNAVIVLCGNLVASLAGIHCLILYAVLKLHTLSVCPGDVIAESFPVFGKLCLDVASKRGVLHGSINS